jgi:hypothetical protein
MAIASVGELESRKRCGLARAIAESDNLEKRVSASLGELIAEGEGEMSMSNEGGVEQETRNFFESVNVSVSRKVAKMHALGLARRMA